MGDLRNEAFENEYILSADGTPVSPEARIALYDRFHEVNSIDKSLYGRYDVKRGLRNSDGTGVVAGLTNICDVHGYVMSDGDRVPEEGRLCLRGYNMYDILADESPEHRFRFEEVASLLISGQLPSAEGLKKFTAALDEQRELPDGFAASVIMSDTPPDIMNVLSRCITRLYFSDPHAEDRTIEHEIKTAIMLLSRLPRIMVLTYYAKRARYNNGSMIIHPFIPGQSTAETILSMLRPDRQFTPEEANMLDCMLCLHAEHGGGNNSTFVTRVMSSADTDPYSTYAAAIGSLKGHRHGGANYKVLAMQEDLKREVKNWEDDDEIAAYLAKIVRKEAFDKTGLVYGMGHAVYTLSDPRAVIGKRFADRLAKGTEHEAEFNLLKKVEELAPQVILDVKGTDKPICANVDMYSGFVYSMLNIPRELYTPLFACSRMAGWAAHRFEEIDSGKRIIRPAYRTTWKRQREFVPVEER